MGFDMDRVHYGLVVIQYILGSNWLVDDVIRRVTDNEGLVLRLVKCASQH